MRTTRRVASLASLFVTISACSSALIAPQPSSSLAATRCARSSSGRIALSSGRLRPSSLVGSDDDRWFGRHRRRCSDRRRRSYSTLTGISMAVLPPSSGGGGGISDGGVFESPRSLVVRGMRLFADGDVLGSIDMFDRADAAAYPEGSLRPYLWQRGISYYYADMFREGSEQFRLDVSVNPLDVEEIVWDIACLARMDPEAEFPPQNKMSLPVGMKDRRRIMSTVYSLFRGDGATEHDLYVAGHDGGSIGDEFYSLFYLGLYCESRGETGKTAGYMTAAASSKYASGLGAADYMSSAAKVHCKIRGWV